MAYVSQNPEYYQVIGLLQKALEVDEIVHQWPQFQVDALLEDISRNVVLDPTSNRLLKTSQRQLQQSFYDGASATVTETDADARNLISKRGMSDEEERRMTFLHENWPRNVPTPSSKLAKAGFFYTGVYDTLECVGCKGRINNWGNGETAIKEHNRLFPHCKFGRGSDRRNASYHGLANGHQEGTEGTLKGQKNTSLLSSYGVSRSKDEYEFQRRHLHNSAQGRPIHLSHLVTSSEPTDLIKKYSKYPDMIIEQARLETYRQWPGSHCQNPANLARAGFFAIGKDEVKCFFCGGEVQNWREDDDPWVKHARLSPGCVWLQHQIGPGFESSTDQTITWQLFPPPADVPYSEDRTQSMSSSVTSEIATKVRDELRRETGGTRMKEPPDQVKKKCQKRKEAESLQEREDLIQPDVLQFMSDSGQGKIAKNRVMKETQAKRRTYENIEGLPTATLKATEKELETDPEFKDLLMKLAEYLTKADIERLCDIFGFSPFSKLKIIENSKPAMVFLLQLWRKQIIKSDDIVSLHDALTELKMLQATKKLKELQRGMKQEHEDMSAEEMERLKERFLCNICCDKIVKILFLPCLHLRCCRVCAFQVETCPFCRERIDERVSVIFHDLLKS